MESLNTASLIETLSTRHFFQSKTRRDLENKKKKNRKSAAFACGGSERRATASKFGRAPLFVRTGGGGVSRRVRGPAPPHTHTHTHTVLISVESV